MINEDNKTSREIILFDGRKVTVREPKVRDLIAAEEVSGEKMQEVHMISNLTALTTDEVMDLPIKDYQKIQTAVQAFLD